jgi:translation initiation factor IF-3
VAADLERKMNQALGFLKRGMRVEIVVAKKKGAARPRNQSDEAAALERAKNQAIIDKIHNMVAHVRGTTVTRDPDGQLGRTMRCFFEGQLLADEDVPEDARNEDDD